MKTWKSLSLLAILALLVSPQAARGADIVDTAVKAGNFKTLATALKAAGLVDTLKGSGPFTVFAPTDDAFAKLPAGTVESLLKPENKGRLTDVLTYHVVAGSVPATEVLKLSGATTVNGQRVDITTDGGVRVDNANVITTDIRCDNGIIHVIDTVLLPSDANLVEVATSAGNFGTLIAAAKAAGLAETLAGQGSTGPLTVLAPTDAAFANLPAKTLDSLLKPENKDKLAAILKYHVIPGRVYSDDALAAGSAKPLAGSPIRLTAGTAGVTAENAIVTQFDLDASNGVIHVIDRVLLPPGTGGARLSDARQTIEQAIASGSAIFNAGRHHACADLYRQTMNTLMPEIANADVRREINRALRNADQQHSSTEKAWALRRGLDRVYTMLP
ncbi:MAG: fasciclin domain-containing protein [Planctomycetota bacterium]